MRRRDLVVLAAVAPAAASAQQPATPPTIPSTPEEERKAAIAQLRGAANTVSKVPLPMATEPAAHFKA